MPWTIFCTISCSYMPWTIFCTISRWWNGNRQACCRMGGASPVLILWCNTLERPKSPSPTEITSDQFFNKDLSLLHSLTFKSFTLSRISSTDWLTATWDQREGFLSNDGSTKFTESVSCKGNSLPTFYNITEAVVRFSSCIVEFLPDDIGDTEWATSKLECWSENSGLGSNNPTPLN